MTPCRSPAGIAYILTLQNNTAKFQKLTAHFTSADLGSVTAVGVPGDPLGSIHNDVKMTDLNTSVLASKQERIAQTAISYGILSTD